MLKVGWSPEALNWFIRLAVSPEAEQDRLTINPQGSCRNKVSKGLNASYWPRGMSSTSPRDSLFVWTALSCQLSALSFPTLANLRAAADRIPGRVGPPAESSLIRPVLQCVIPEIERELIPREPSDIVQGKILFVRTHSLHLMNWGWQVSQCLHTGSKLRC